MRGVRVCQCHIDLLTPLTCPDRDRDRVACQGLWNTLKTEAAMNNISTISRNLAPKLIVLLLFQHKNNSSSSEELSCYTRLYLLWAPCSTCSKYSSVYIITVTGILL